MDNGNDKVILFEILTPLNFTVRTTKNYWKIITTIKHPIMKEKEDAVKKTLSDPDEIRKSKNDQNVYLFYKRENEKEWVCAIAKRLNGEGFLITAFPTDSIKEGERIWNK